MTGRNILLIICLMTFASVALAQTEARDSIGVGVSEVDIEELTKPIDGQGLMTGPSMSEGSGQGFHSSIKEDLPLGPTLVKAPEVFSFPRVNLRPARLPDWETGYIYGSSAHSANLLYGYMAAANMGIRQHFGDQWTADVQLGVQKMSVMANTTTMNGQLNWHPSPYFEATVFGGYSPGSFMSMVDIGQSFQWGGFLTFQTDTRVKFGVDVGARQTYDYMFGHELVPIVQPFVKVGGAKIGIDLGPMIKEAQRKKNGGYGGGGANPIPQPIKALPPVAPRR